VPGSLVLLGGEPGIGKSTLILQLSLISAAKQPVFYISGEESADQIKMRVDRIGEKIGQLKFLNETNLEVIGSTLTKLKPPLAIIDSIQTIYSDEVDGEAGSINQVKLATSRLLEVAKKNKIAVVIIGHVTKRGNVAGPKTLEHFVDTVLYLEGDPHHAFRILRAHKNRFGATSEVGIFDMQEKGLQEVKNPSALFLEDREAEAVGSVITPIIEGSRCFLIEIQSLVTKTHFGYPRRIAGGLDFRKPQLLIAVLIKRARLFLGNQDINVNVAGGFQVKEPAVDLAIALAITSAYKNQAIDFKTAVVGEIGLTGELRSVSQLDQRVAEAEKMGFERIVVSANSRLVKQYEIELIKAKNLSEAIELVFI
jgi:DNA repair protein RadA/Sms